MTQKQTNGNEKNLDFISSISLIYFLNIYNFPFQKLVGIYISMVARNTSYSVSNTGLVFFPMASKPPSIDFHSDIIKQNIYDGIIRLLSVNLIHFAPPVFITLNF